LTEKVIFDAGLDWTHPGSIGGGIYHQVKLPLSHQNYLAALALWKQKQLVGGGLQTSIEIWWTCKRCQNGE